MEQYDVIIVGAGSAGIMAAKILSGAKRNVCIVEAKHRLAGGNHRSKKNGFKTL